MKRLINVSTILVFILIILSFSAAAAELKDVSKDHWAYQSVKKLIDKGYLSLYEDGTFKGENDVSRYELAVIIARMLDNIQEEDTQVSREDADTLRKLSLEFRNELVEVAKKQEDLFKKVKNIEEKNIIQTNALGNNREKISAMQQEISNIVDNIIRLKNLNEKVEILNKKVKEQTLTIEKIEKDLNEHKNIISEINKEMQDVSNEVGSQQAINNLKDQQSVTVTNVHNLKNQVNNLNEKVQNQEATITNLKEDNKKYKIYLIAVAILSLASF